MMAHVVNAQPDRDRKTGADHGNADNPGAHGPHRVARGGHYPTSPPLR